MWRLKCVANLRQLWTVSCLTENERRQGMWRRKTTLILITRRSLPCLAAAACTDVNAHVPLRARHVCPPALLCETLRASVCVCFLHRCAYAGGGCEAVQSPGRTEWIYKLMEFKASSIDYHYNKQQHTECLIIFRQRFCALSSNSADAVTLSDICL